MFGLFALPVVIMAGYLIIKKHNTQMVLFSTGLLMSILGVLYIHFSGGTDFHLLPKGVKSSGAVVFDLFLVIKSITSSTVANLGLMIMAAGGFSKYMNHIGAADAMVRVTVKPLSLIKNQYLILAFAYILGQFLNIFIPSAIGLAMLLLVALYPTLVKVGCTPMASVAVLATTGCLDLGPASGTANKAAEVLNISPISYFYTHQIPVAIIVVLVIAILHIFVQRYFDKVDLAKGVTATLAVEEKPVKAPISFAILPVLPLCFLLGFSKYGIVTTVSLDVVTAMFISLFISMIADYIYKKDFKSIGASLKVFFDAMGATFASIVSLIIAAQVFVVGLNCIGFTGLMLSTAKGLGFGALEMSIVLVSIIGVTTILSGSGNAAFYSFSGLAPNVANSVGASAASIALPMQFSAGMFRSFSPVAGVVIACAGVANISPIEVAKRTAIPMIGGIIATLIAVHLFPY